MRTFDGFVPEDMMQATNAKPPQENVKPTARITRLRVVAFVCLFSGLVLFGAALFLGMGHGNSTPAETHIFVADDLVFIASLFLTLVWSAD